VAFPVTNARVPDASRRRGRFGYAICTTPRAGSNYLGQILQSTGILGRPLEYLNGPARRKLGWQGYPDDPAAQLEIVLTEGATDNGCYAIKLFPSQADGAPGWAQALPKLRFVHLRRRDVLGQAISWARAEQTGRYRSTSKSSAEPVYDPDRIQARLADIVREEARWSLFFARRTRRPVRLIYEEVMADPQKAADAVAKAVGIEPAPCDLSGLDLEIQRDELNEEWRARFLAERSMGLAIDPI
jgi:LPS sulfotransferase NodH